MKASVSRVLLSGTIALSVLAMTTDADAQGDATSAAAAEKLFQEGRAFIKQGRWSDACPKLAESLRLDPAVGTALNLAECYERIDRVASAWVTYRKAETMARRAGQRERYTHAAARAEALEGTLSYLTITLATRPKGISVVRDGESVGEAAWGTAVPIDGGAHVIEVTAPGRRTWRRELNVAARASRLTVDVPALEAEPVASAISATTSPVGEGPAPSPVQATIGWITAGAGVVSLGAGLAFGAIAKSRYDDASTHCSDVDCDARGVTLTSDARSAATLSTVLVVAGGVLTVGGVALVLTAPKRDTARPSASAQLGLSISPAACGAWATF